MFVLTRVLPGNPAFMVVGLHADEEVLQATIERMGLDRPIPEQYINYIGQVIKGDLGTAWRTSYPVTHDLKFRFPATMELSTYSLLIAIFWSVILGVWSAVKSKSFVSKAADVVTAAGVSIPEFWLGIMLIVTLYSLWDIAPPPLGRIAMDVDAPKAITGLYVVDSILTRNWVALRSSSAQLALPVMTLAFVIGAPIMRLTRTFMLEALGSDYVRSARAYGLPQSTIIFRHALRNALLPMTTMIGMIYGYLLGGTVLIEKVFAWPGMGKYAVDAMLASDYSAIMAVVLVSASMYLVVYLIIDVVHFTLDPRTR